MCAPRVSRALYFNHNSLPKSYCYSPPLPPRRQFYACSRLFIAHAALVLIREPGEVGLLLGGL